MKRREFQQIHLLLLSFLNFFNSVITHVACHTCVAWSKLDKRTNIAKGLKHKGLNLSFLFIGDQNRNFLKLKGEKVHFSQNIFVNTSPSHISLAETSL